MNAVIDASLAMQNLINSAEEFGLGICPISMVRNHLEEVKKMCHLPEGVFPIAGLSVGWPDENNEVSIRLPMKVVFHEDFYNDKDIINQIDDYDKTIQSFQPIPNQNKGMYMFTYLIKKILGLKISQDKCHYQREKSLKNG